MGRNPASMLKHRASVQALLGRNAGTLEGIREGQSAEAARTYLNRLSSTFVPANRLSGTQRTRMEISELFSLMGFIRTLATSCCRLLKEVVASWKRSAVQTEAGAAEGH